jgi:hypothetical protein
MLQDKTAKKILPPPHYYGDTVRKLFLAGAVLMLVSFPLFKEFISLPMYFSIFSVVAVVFLAGFQNPRQRFIILLNTVAATTACVIFEYEAIIFSASPLLSSGDFIYYPYFWVNQALALIFLVATYYSSKTLRAAFVHYRSRLSPVV